MTENLPVVPTGGAVVVQPAALVQVDAAAAAGALAGLSDQARRDVQSPAAEAVFELDPALTQALAPLVKDLRSDLIIDGVFDEEHFARFVPVLAEYAPAFAKAVRAQAAREGDDSGLRHLTQILEGHLLTKGLSRERIGWARAILARYEPRFRSLFAGGRGAVAGPSTADVDELRELERMMGDLGSAYNYRGIDPLRQAQASRLQGRARELYQRGVRSDSKRATAPEHVNKRKAELEALMADTSSEYWKGPSAEALQAEYRDLLR